MARYRLWHRTIYRYDEPVTISHNLAHLLPRPCSRQRWQSPSIDVFPLPAMLRQRDDFFGNPLTLFAIQEPHRVLQVTSKGIVDVDPPEPDPLVCSQPWEVVRQRLSELTGEAKLEHLQYLPESPFIRWNDEVLAYASLSFTPGRPLLEAVLDLTARIHRDFVYDPAATTVSTTVAELMTRRRGVCQDLGHVQIACLRTIGLASRYVSGYLLTTPQNGRPRLVGADASHAWVSLFLPDAGWIDFDPTNNLRPADRHVTIAWGRDYGDVCPLRGVILGGGRQTVQVNVDVTPEPLDI